jgi:hypothetical protein
MFPSLSPSPPIFSEWKGLISKYGYRVVAAVWLKFEVFWYVTLGD